MASSECYNFNICSAPLCPMDEESLEHGIWYADEDICILQPAGRFVKTQKKIIKANRKKDVEGYFTHKMLNRNYRVMKGHSGCDPDKDEKAEEKRYLEAHKEITPEQMQKLKERGQKVAAKYFKT